MNAPTRLIDSPPPSGAPDARAIELLRSDVEVAEMPESAFHRIECSLEERTDARSLRLPQIRWAAIAGALACSSLAAATVSHYRAALIHVLWSHSVAPPLPAPSQVSPPLGAKPNAPAEPEPVQISATALRRALERARSAHVAAPVPSPKPPPVTHMTEAAVAPAKPASTAVEEKDLFVPVPFPRNPDDPIVAESRVLEKALVLLRSANDPVRALAVLDAYDVRYPHGLLAKESFIARIDALIAAGRRATALKLLNGLDPRELASTPRADELWVLRAELLAESGQCEEANSVFDELAAGPTGEVQGRALFGRALCFAKRGDALASERDLRAYLERYPSGALADQVRKALVGHEP